MCPRLKSRAGSHREGIRTVHGRILDIPERGSSRGCCHPRHVEKRCGSNRQPGPEGAFWSGKGEHDAHPSEVLCQQLGERCVDTVASGVSQVDLGRPKARTQ